MSSERVLWYFADPMCSWCWGFSPVITEIRHRYKDRLSFVLVMGGLRAGVTDPMTAAFRSELISHWREVQLRTGQPFTLEGALPDGFVYDTEPASRAVAAVHDIDPSATLAYFTSIQAAFYVQQCDVTRTDVLTALAQGSHIEPAAFTERFESERIRQITQAHFAQTARVGIRGFPSVVLQNDAGAMLLTHGWQPLAALVPPIDEWLATGVENSGAEK
jgi:putative protein-disulfide isomerase